MIKIYGKDIPEESILVESIPKKERTKIEVEIAKLQQNAKAKKVLLLDKTGKNIITSIDHTNTNTEKKIDEVNKLLKENGGCFFGSPNFLKDNVHISIIADCFVLVIVFDEDSSLGFVRLSLKHCKNELESFLLNLISQMKTSSLFNNQFLFLLNPITDSEMDELDFSFPDEAFLCF